MDADDFVAVALDLPDDSDLEAELPGAECQQLTQPHIEAPPLQREEGSQLPHRLHAPPLDLFGPIPLVHAAHKAGRGECRQQVDRQAGGQGWQLAVEQEPGEVVRGGGQGQQLQEPQGEQQRSCRCDA